MARKKKMAEKAWMNDVERDIEAREAYRKGHTKKTFHQKDLKNIKPLTSTQEELFHTAHNKPHLALIGSAGTGKTFLSMFLALREVLNKETPYERVIIVRSAVQTRDIGFLPGSEEEKTEVYEAPYRAICNDLFPFSKSYDNLKKNGYVEFMSTSFVRGITLKNCIVIVDECQSQTFHELESVITRVGDNCRIFFCGDTKQNDLVKHRGDQSGLEEFLKILDKIDDFGIVSFTVHDIVRSGLVKAYLLAKERM